MSKRLTGLNPLAYRGVEPTSPPQLVVVNRSPTVNDRFNFNIGTIWIRKDPQEIWVLVSLAQGIATWIQLSPGGGSGGTNDYVTDVGTATQVGGILNVLGGTNINTTGSGNTVTTHLDDSITLSGSLTVTSLGAGVVQTTAGGLFFSDNGMDGQVLIGGGSAPVWTNLTAGTNITITNGPNSISIAAAGSGSGTTTFHTDSGDATEAGGAITIAGGSNINTSGAGSTVTVNLDNTVSISGSLTVGTTITAGTGLTVSSFGAGVVQTNSSGVFTSNKGTNGQILISSTAGVPAWANITSTGATVDITNGANTINLEVAGGGGAPGSTCAFLAIQPTTVLGVSGDGTVYTMGTDAVMQVIFDNGSNFFIGDGVGGAATFTAPVTGQYLFNFYCTLAVTVPPAPSGVGNILVDIVTPNRTYSFAGNETFPLVILATPTGQVTQRGVTVCLDMTIGDVTTFNCAVLLSAGGTPTTMELVGGTSTVYTWISGFLFS